MIFLFFSARQRNMRAAQLRFSSQTEQTRVVESKSLKVGKSLKIGKNRIKSEKSDLISF